MIITKTPGKIGLYSIKEINELPQNEKEKLYTVLIPDQIFSVFNIRNRDIEVLKNNSFSQIYCDKNSDFVKIEIKTEKAQKDWVFLLEVADTIYYQLELSLIVTGDPQCRFYDVFSDKFGHQNYFATMVRNIPEEKKALQDGLFPHQARKGLKIFDELMKRLENFAESMDKHLIETDPLAYNNAIFYEKKGFAYIHGKNLMETIDSGFHPGGLLYHRLDDSNIFRKKHYWKGLRGRSWAIHDGVLKETLDTYFDNVKMYKPIGKRLKVNTFST